MSGGITQLVSTGVQDEFITGNPEVSFFKTNYRRHTNFAQCVSRQVIRGNPAPGGTSTVRLEHLGDLVSSMYLTSESTTSAVERHWSNIIESVELHIGDQLIDKQDFTFSNDLAVDLFATNMSKSFWGGHYSGGSGTQWFYPLRFFCCETSQSALPLISLQYHDVVIKINWSNSFDPATNKMNFYANFIYLDAYERNKFSTSPQQLLIYQVQKTLGSNGPVQNFYFNHPVKFIAAKESSDACTSNTSQLTFQINGVDLSDKKYAKPHYTMIPSYYSAPYAAGNEDAYFLHAFCLDTSSIQPSGTLNFSRVDSARLMSDNQNFTSTFYAVNYNILKIESGMGGLLYAD